jgi:flagellar secretion chaperone FliS
MSAYPRAGNLAAYQTVATHGGVAASDPHGLIVMMLDGAMERIAAARGYMANNVFAEKGRLIGRAAGIVDELRISLDLVRGGTLAQNLEALYDYIGRQLLRANAENRLDLLDEVTGLLQEIRTAWIAIPADARTARAPGK